MVQAILWSSGLHPRPVYRVHLAACGFRSGLFNKGGVIRLLANAVSFCRRSECRQTRIRRPFV